MMSTPADDSLADDDLDITARLPILSSADIGDAPPDLDDATGQYPMPPGAIAAMRDEAGAHWDLSDELVPVRDRIDSLESALADTEFKLTQLQAGHDALQSQYTDLLIHSQAVSRDRDRLAEESRLALASRQQMQDQLEELRQHGEALQAELLTAQQQFAEQHASAAALARSMAQAMLEKERLGQALATERQALESTRGELSERQAEIGALQDEVNRAVIENEHSVTLLREELGQLQLQLQERDKLALEQASKLDEFNSTNLELIEQLRQRDQTAVTHAERVASLSATVQRLQDQSTRQDEMLQQARQELAAKQLEQGASARQVEALQVELHQHVEAMQAIRRDIHQVALQTRKSESATLLRTLTRDDAEGVVHLLNKSSISIGRGHECDIQLRSSSVSRYHAVLRTSHDAVIFEDMNSTNGCFVNGRRITRRLLKDGDVLKVGAVPLRFGIRTPQD